LAVRSRLVALCCFAAIAATGCGGAGAHPPVQFLPGGIRTVARGSVPGGPAFAIVAQRYRFEGAVHVDLSSELGGHGGPAGATSSFSPLPSQPFSWSAQVGCTPARGAHWAIVYGLLSSGSYRAYVYSGRRRLELRRAAIPPSIHQRGEVAYAGAPEPLRRVLVRAADGRVVENQQLAALPALACGRGESASVTSASVHVFGGA